MRFNFRSVIKILVLIFLASCAEEKVKVPPEDNLLNYFKVELSFVEQHQDDYAGYMLQQLVYYKKKNRLFTEAIEEVNSYFEDLPEDEKETYQRRQRARFQPIIDAIYDKTRQMIIQQTATLTPEKMAKIQEYSTKLDELEKNIPAIKLVPVFFIAPELPKKTEPSKEPQ